MVATTAYTGYAQRATDNGPKNNAGHRNPSHGIQAASLLLDISH
jgi:hypothetical protein